MTIKQVSVENNWGKNPFLITCGLTKFELLEVRLRDTNLRISWSTSYE